MIPVEIMESAAFHALSLVGKFVLLCLAAQYSGGNNGRLTLPLTAARHLGLRSKDSLSRGLAELVRVQLIEVTHQGGLPPHGCSKYALTWRGIDPAASSGVIAAAPSHRWTKYTGKPSGREPPKRRTAAEAAEATGRNASSSPTSGPHCPDQRTTEGPRWSDHRTTEAAPVVRPTDPSKILGGGTPSDKVRSLLHTMPDLSDAEVARIAHTDAGLVAQVRGMQAASSRRMIGEGGGRMKPRGHSEREA